MWLFLLRNMWLFRYAEYGSFIAQNVAISLRRMWMLCYAKCVLMLFVAPWFRHSQLIRRCMKRPVSHCETGHIVSRNGSYRAAKRPESQNRVYNAVRTGA